MTNETESIMIEEESGKRRNVQQQRWRCVPVVMSILVLLMLVLVAVTGRFTHSGELSTRGFYPKNTNFAIKAESSSDRIAAMLQSMCGPHEEGCTYNNPSDKDPEPSDPGSSDTGSPDGSSCEMFEEDCPYNKPPSDTNQPEVTEDKKGMEPLSNKSKKSVFLKWLNVTYPWLSPRQFQWQNESAAQPAVEQANWLMACHILANTSPTLWLMSLEEKRVYAYWAEWVVQTAEEFADFWMKDPNYPREFAIVKRQLYLLQKELSNN